MGSGELLQSSPEVRAVNESILQRRFPNLVSLLNATDGSLEGTIRVQTTRSGHPTIAVESGATAVHVHSTFQPIVEAERWVRGLLQREWDVAVVYGMGLGYHLDVLMSQRPQCRLVVIEPRTDVFRASMMVRDQQRLMSHPYLEFIVTDDPVAAAQELFSGHLKDLLNGIAFFVWPPAARYAPDYLKTFESQLVDMLRTVRTDLATRQMFHLQWINNFFENISYAIRDPGVGALRKQLAGRPAIIASAGPSLEKNVHLLAEAKGKAVIIAAGSAINPLLKYGIEPDLLVSFDAGEANYQHFERLRTSYLPLIYISTIFPRVLKEYPGPRFTAAMDTFPFIGWLFDQLGEDKGLLISGPSVANVAWQLAYVLEMNPIILVGQDLAFTGGKTHAAGAVHAREVVLNTPNQQGRYITTEGIDGLPVTTTRPMYTMKVWFERMIRTAPSTHLTIDATEGGAKIAGTTLMPLADALKKYCQEAFNPYETIMAIHRTESQRLQMKKLEQRISNIFADLVKQLEFVNVLTKEGITDANRLLWESSTKRLNEQRLNEAKKRLGRHHMRLAGTPVYKQFIEPATTHVLRSIGLRVQAQLEKEMDLFANGAEVAQQYNTLFTSTRDVARHIARLLREHSGE